MADRRRPYPYGHLLILPMYQKYYVNLVILGHFRLFQVLSCYFESFRVNLVILNYLRPAHDLQVLALFFLASHISVVFFLGFR